MKRLTTEDFILKAKLVHGDKYDYSKVIYKSAHLKINIICPIHGEFEQEPNNHTYGFGCLKCGTIKTGEAQSVTQNEVIDAFTVIHGDKYDYSKVIYIKDSQHVVIICQIHGEFKQRPSGHKVGKGCSECNESKGEEMITKLLLANNIKFVKQNRFQECRYKKPLPFDFYLPKDNICIEYHGLQHYKPIPYFGGLKYFNDQQIRDKIKTEYCQKNSIPLVVIKYGEDIKLALSNILT